MYRTDSDTWAPNDVDPDDGIPDDNGSRMDLSAWLYDQANRYLDLGTDAGGLVAETLAELAGAVEMTGARDVEEFRERDAIMRADRD
jgi:hypothetical protein